MSYSEGEGLAEFRGTIQAGRLARQKAKVAKRMKSPEAKSLHEKAKRITKEGTDSYAYTEKHQYDRD